MSDATTIGLLKQAAGMRHAGNDPDSLIGLFQACRAEPSVLDEAFESLSGGKECLSRLQVVYEASGCGRRGDAMQDAYFIVRNPPHLTAARAQHLAESLLSSIAHWLKEQASEALASSGDTLSNRLKLDALPKVRVLEGKAPKSPKTRNDRSQFEIAMLDDLPDVVNCYVHQKVGENSVPALLGPALYFISCDALLRDCLRWPLIDIATDHDPFNDYLELWRHGAKLRMFSEDTLDIYLPRRESGHLIDAGPNAGLSSPALD